MQDAAQPHLLRLNCSHVQWTYEPKVEGVLQVFSSSAYDVNHARQQERISRNVLSMNFIVLLHRSCAKPPVVFQLQNSIFTVGGSASPKGVTLFTYRPNNKAPAIRCRIHQSDGQSRVEYLNSKYASYACQSDSDSIYPFSHGAFGSLPSASRSLEFGGWSVPGPKLGLTINQTFVRSCAKSPQNLSFKSPV